MFPVFCLSFEIKSRTAMESNIESIKQVLLNRERSLHHRKSLHPFYNTESEAQPSSSPTPFIAASTTTKRCCQRIIVSSTQDSVYPHVPGEYDLIPDDHRVIYKRSDKKIFLSRSCSMMTSSVTTTSPLEEIITVDDSQVCFKSISSIYSHPPPHKIW